MSSSSFRILSLFLTVLLLFESGRAFRPEVVDTSSGGEYLVSPSIFYMSGLRTRSSREETSYYSTDFRFGYQILTNTYLGISYQLEQKNVESMGFTVESFNNTSKMKRNSYGVFVTYNFEPLHFSATYQIESKLVIENKNAISTTRYEYTGSAYQIDLGYRFSFLGISAGPQLSYKYFVYPKLNIDGDGTNQITPKLEESNFEPSFVAFFFF